MRLEATEKKRLFVFLGIAFLLPYALGILMGYGYYKGVDVSAFPNAQMFYPAAGVMLAVLLIKREGELVPKRFYIGFVGMTAIMMLLAVASVFIPGMWIMAAVNLVIIIGSLTLWIFLLTEKKEKRRACGLCLGKGKQSVWMVVLFLIFYIGRIVVSCAVSGGMQELAAMFQTPYTYIMMVSLAINFFLVFAAFFGEEYGWRYYFAPLLQKHFGKKAGVLLLGVLWGLWHLPINVFYYSPDTWLQSVVSQQITCISLGIFFTYAYEKSGTIWVPVILHMLNNNLIAVFSGGDATVLNNQIITWPDVAVALVINAVCFLPFLFTKELKENEELQKGIQN
ncbi:MAG: CPBP family intramembrane glutamic endopeptidase [Hungatella sp.]